MSPHFISSEIGVLSSTEEGVSLFVTLGVLFRTYAGFCNCMGLLRNRMMRKEGIKKEFVLHVSFDTSQFFSARCIRERAYAFCSAFIAREEKEREKREEEARLQRQREEDAYVAQAKEDVFPSVFFSLTDATENRRDRCVVVVLHGVGWRGGSTASHVGGAKEGGSVTNRVGRTEEGAGEPDQARCGQGVAVALEAAQRCETSVSSPPTREGEATATRGGARRGGRAIAVDTVPGRNRHECVVWVESDAQYRS